MITLKVETKFSVVRRYAGFDAPPRRHRLRLCEADVGGHVIETFLGQSEGGLKKFGKFDPFPQAKPHGYGPGYRI